MHKHRLLLPLHNYDAVGRIIPPWWWYPLLLLNCLDWLLLLLIALGGEKTERLLPMIYPDKRVLWYGLAAAIPLLLAVVMVSQRERLWQKLAGTWVSTLRYLWWAGLTGEGMLTLWMLSDSSGHFSWPTALRIILVSTTGAAFARSRHIRLMINDWSINNYR